MVSTRYTITTHSKYGNVHVSTWWSDVSEGYDQGPGEVNQEFPTLEAALSYTGGCRYDMDGNLVNVYLDGQLVDDAGNTAYVREGTSEGWSFGTDSGD